MDDGSQKLLDVIDDPSALESFLGLNTEAIQQLHQLQAQQIRHTQRQPLQQQSASQQFLSQKKSKPQNKKDQLQQSSQTHKVPLQSQLPLRSLPKPPVHSHTSHSLPLHTLPLATRTSLLPSSASTPPTGLNSPVTSRSTASHTPPSPISLLSPSSRQTLPHTLLTPNLPPPLPPQAITTSLSTKPVLPEQSSQSVTVTKTVQLPSESTVVKSSSPSLTVSSSTNQVPLLAEKPLQRKVLSEQSCVESDKFSEKVHPKHHNTISQTQPSNSDSKESQVRLPKSDKFCSRATGNHSLSFVVPSKDISTIPSTSTSTSTSNVPSNIVFTTFPQQISGSESNSATFSPLSSTLAVVSSASQQTFSFAPVTVVHSSCSSAISVRSGVPTSLPATVVTSVPTSVTGAISLGASGIQIGGSGMPIGSPGITIGPSGLTLNTSAISNIPISSATSTSANVGTGPIFGSGAIPVSSLGSSGVLVGPGAVFPATNIPIPTSSHTVSSPGSPFSVPTRSPAPHVPPTPSPSPLPLRSPASVPPHPPSPALSPYHSSLQSPQTPLTSNSSNFTLSSNAAGSLMKDSFSNLPILQQSSNTSQSSNNFNSQTPANFVFSTSTSANNFKDAFGNVQPNSSSSVVVLPSRTSGTVPSAAHIAGQNRNSQSPQASLTNLQSPQSIILSHSNGVSIQTCSLSVASQNQSSQSSIGANTPSNVPNSNTSSLSQQLNTSGISSANTILNHLGANSGVNVQSTQITSHISTSIQSPQSSVLVGNGSTRSPAPPGSNLTSAATLTPTPSPSPQHRTVPSPVIRSTTPTPGQATVVHQALPGGLTLSGPQQYPVVPQGSTAMLQTSNHQVLQIFHHPPASVPGTSFPGQAQIITTGHGTPVHIHAATANTGTLPPKPKQPPQILPKPPGSSGLSAGSNSKIGGNNRANIASSTPQGLHASHHGTAGTQVVIGQANQAAVIPTAQGGALVLNQVIPGLTSGPVLVQHNPNGGVQLILRPPTPGTQGQTVGQSSQNKASPAHGSPVLISGHGTQQLLQNAARQQSVSQQQQQQQQQQQVLRLIAQGPMHIQPIQTATGPTFIAVPSAQTLSLQTVPHLPTSQAALTSQQTSRQPGTQLSLQPSSILPTVLNNIQSTVPPSGVRGGGNSVQSLNITVPNINISASPNSNTTPCSHNAAVLGQTVTIPSIANQSSSVIHPSQNSDHVPDNGANNLGINNSNIIRPNGNIVLHSNPSSDLCNVTNSVSATRETNSNSMMGASNLPPPKKKPKKKKKKKMDLANIMKLSGIDDDDMTMFDQEDPSNQQIVGLPNSNNNQSINELTPGSSQIISQLQSPSQVPIHTGGQSSLRFTLEDGTVVLHSATTPMQSADNQQQNATSSSPHLISTGTNTTNTRTSASASLSPSAGSQANQTHYVSTTFAASNEQMSQSGNSLIPERHTPAIKPPNSLHRDTFTEVSLIAQQPASINVKNENKVNSHTSNSGPPLGFAVQCKAPSDMKDNIASISLASVSGILTNANSGSMSTTGTSSSGTVNVSDSSVTVVSCISGNTNVSASSLSSCTSTKPTSRSSILLANSSLSKSPQNSFSNSPSSINIQTFVPSLNTPTLRNCSQIETSKYPIENSKPCASTCTPKLQSSSPSHFTNSGVLSERTVSGNSAMTQTDSIEVSSVRLSSSTCTSSYVNAAPKLGEHHTMFLPVCSTGQTTNFSSAKTTIANTDATHMFLGLHSIQNLQGLVSSTTNVPVMATLPPASSNAPSGSSTFTAPLPYTGEQLVIAHQGGIPIAGTQLLQCLQQAQGQQSGLMNVSPITALSKVLGSAPGLTFNAGTILIGGNPVENFSNNQQKTTPIVSNNTKFIPQQSVLLQQLNSGMRRCSTESATSSISLSSPPPVISLINQTASPSNQLVNHSTRKTNAPQQSIETQTQTVPIGVQSAIQNTTNVLPNIQNNFLDSISQSHPGLIVNKIDKSPQYTGVINTLAGQVSKKKKKKAERQISKVVTTSTSPGVIPLQNVLSSDSVKGIVQDRLVAKTIVNQSSCQNQLNSIGSSVTLPVVTSKISSESTSFYVTTPFTVASNMKGVPNITATSSVPPLAPVSSVSQSISQIPANVFCHLGGNVTTTNSQLTLPVVTVSTNLSKLSVQSVNSVAGNTQENTVTSNGQTLPQPIISQLSHHQTQTISQDHSVRSQNQHQGMAQQTQQQLQQPQQQQQLQPPQQQLQQPPSQQTTTTTVVHNLQEHSTSQSPSQVIHLSPQSPHTNSVNTSENISPRTISIVVSCANTSNAVTETPPKGGGINPSMLRSSTTSPMNVSNNMQVVPHLAGGDHNLSDIDSVSTVSSSQNASSSNNIGHVGSVNCNLRSNNNSNDNCNSNDKLSNASGNSISCSGGNNCQNLNSNSSSTNSGASVSVGLVKNHQQITTVMCSSVQTCTTSQLNSSQSHINSVNPTLPHLVPIPVTSIGSSPGSAQGVATITGIQAQISGLPGSIFQKLHTIHLTPQNQKQIKAVPFQIQSIMTKKNQSDDASLHMLITQQRILTTGKVVPTVPGQSSQGLQFSSTATNLASLALENQQPQMAANVTLLQSQGNMALLHAQLPQLTSSSGSSTSNSTGATLVALQPTLSLPQQPTSSQQSSTVLSSHPITQQQQQSTSSTISGSVPHSLPHSPAPAPTQSSQSPSLQSIPVVQQPQLLLLQTPTSQQYQNISPTTFQQQQSQHLQQPQQPTQQQQPQLQTPQHQLQQSQQQIQQQQQPQQTSQQPLQTQLQQPLQPPQHQTQLQAQHQLQHQTQHQPQQHQAQQPLQAQHQAQLPQTQSQSQQQLQQQHLPQQHVQHQLQQQIHHQQQSHLQTSQTQALSMKTSVVTTSSATKSCSPVVCEKSTSPIQVQVGTQTVLPSEVSSMETSSAKLLSNVSPTSNKTNTVFSPNNGKVQIVFAPNNKIHQSAPAAVKSASNKMQHYLLNSCTNNSTSTSSNTNILTSNPKSNDNTCNASIANKTISNSSVGCNTPISTTFSSVGTASTTVSTITVTTSTITTTTTTTSTTTTTCTTTVPAVNTSTVSHASIANTVNTVPIVGSNLNVGNNSVGLTNNSSNKTLGASAPVSPPANGMINRGIKRPATSPLRPTISRSDLIEQQLKTDQAGASFPDTKSPFSSTGDACKRLIRYHVFNEKVLSQQDLEKADEIFEATAKHLLDKFRQMMSKYHYLLLMESTREVNTSELVMIDRMFVAEEHNVLERLKEEERKAKEDLANRKGELGSNGLLLPMNIKVENEIISNQEATCSSASDLKEVRVVVQDVMKNESIKRELEEDQKFTIVKREKLDLEESSNETFNQNHHSGAKVDQGYDEWEEIQKELSVFTGSGVKSEKTDVLDSSSGTLPVEAESNIGNESHDSKHVHSSKQDSAEFSCSNSVTNLSLRLSGTVKRFEVMHNSPDSTSHDYQNLNEIPTKGNSGVNIHCGSSDEHDWAKKFPVTIGGVKNRSGVGGPRDEGGGEGTSSKGYVHGYSSRVSSTSESEVIEVKEACDSVESALTFLPKKKRHKHIHGVIPSNNESTHYVKNIINENVDVCDDDEINAQVQSAIDSILNLQRTDDVPEQPSNSVANMSSEVNDLVLQSDSRSRLESESKSPENRTFLHKKLKGDISNSQIRSPSLVEYSGEVDFASKSSDVLVTNGRSMEDDSSENADSALDEAVRSILTS